jgi:16S rRNA (cytosine967-C5)-methyltransferase
VSLAREVAFEAITAPGYLDAHLDAWARETHPERRELAFARELAAGTVRWQQVLDRMIKTRARLPKDQRQRALLRLTLYQILFLDVPPYAAINEGVRLANRLFHRKFSGFLNAVMRSLAADPPPIPPAREAYPSWFVEVVEKTYPEQAAEIFETMNRPPTPMTRNRLTGEVKVGIPDTLAPDAYVQNITQVELLTRACEGLAPTRMLDLCAAPGGKAILLHDLFPEATLVVNDLKDSPRLRQNLADYGVEAEIYVGPGEEFSDGDFDLILIDAPCSNSGVFHKRPEARWRHADLSEIQDRLIAHAKTLLRPGGTLIYMTCSILPSEMRLAGGAKEIILPHGEWDGGSCHSTSRGVSR